MKNDTINKTTILKKALSQGIINLDEVQSMVDKMEREHILQQHKYNIWLASDGRWKTYVDDETKKSGRKLVPRSTKEDLEDFLVDFYSNESDEMTIRKLYPIWLEFKWSHTNAGTYIKRINMDWNKYYDKDEIVDKPISSLTKNVLDKWIHDCIKDNNFSKKQFYNMSVIIRQMYEYAFDEGIVDKNYFAQVKINRKLFRKVKKKKDSTQVFLTDEKPIVEKLCWDDYQYGYYKTKYITALIIAFCFQTGLRVGEAVAIKFKDVSKNGNTIHINRSEVRNVDLIDGIVTDKGVKIASYTKTDDSDREVYLTQKAREIIKEAKKFNDEYGLYDEGFIFLSPKNKRITEQTVVTKLEQICRKAHIPNKTMHKIRKTYVSMLLSSGVSLNEVRKQVGHSDERTTLNDYCYNVNTLSETELQFENAL